MGGVTTTVCEPESTRARGTSGSAVSAETTVIGAGMTAAIVPDALAKPSGARHHASGRLERGDVLKGRYEIVSLIGEGGMSRVYLATDRELTNKQWAVKEVDRSATDPAGRPIEQSLANEARLLSGLDHPNIVRIVDTLKTDSFIYVVMDHVEGQTLEDLVGREGRQREDDVRGWMLQLCDALGYLHRQEPAIIYRDVKPSNIMLHPDGYIKLIDLGVAREYRSGARRDTIAFGTTGYAAPEQYGKAQTDARADIYGVGATMWHLLAGEAPPQELPLPDVRSKNPQVNEGFAEVIIPSCCQPDPSRRYQTTAELAADLRSYELLTREYREGVLRRVRIFAANAAIGAVCLLVGLACLGVRELGLTRKYENQMSIAAAEVTSDTEGSEQAYLDAVGYRPGEVEPYLGLIECYKVDGSFSVEERAQFEDAYQRNLPVLRGSARYSELEYEIGRLYWYFYGYGADAAASAAGDGGAASGGSAANGAASGGLVASGGGAGGTAAGGAVEAGEAAAAGSEAPAAGEPAPDGNRTTRIKASAEHFHIAAGDTAFEKAVKARVYDGIAQFTVNIAAAVKTDDDDAEMYASYWASLVELAELVVPEGNETVRLDGLSLITNALETYMDKFRAAGVSGGDAEALYAAVRDGLAAVRTSDADAEARRAAILSRLENEARRKLASVFGEPGAGLLSAG